MARDNEALELDADQPGKLTQDQNRLQWFINARFGLFIHWGIYAMGARHEQLQRREAMPFDQYKRYFEHFDPDLYDPEKWADLAAAAGMKYFVITTKHHDGFCLWDTDLTDFKVTNTPYGKDLIGPMVDAFRSRGIRVGFYYSQIDWHHPHFTVDDLHYLKDEPNRDELNKGRDMDKYRQFMHGQLRELLTRYGDIDVLWFDGGDYRRSRKLPGEPWDGKGPDDWDVPKMQSIIRECQPNILINDRLGTDWEAGSTADFICYEQALPSGQMTSDGQAVAWESPQTFSGSWGYHRDETTWKTAEQLLEMLLYTTSRGGNMLLNVGPTGRGEIDSRATSRLETMGKWMKYHRKSVHGCTAPPADITPPDKCVLTYNEKTNRLYMHILSWPATPGVRGLSTHLYWKNMNADRIAYAQLLNDASEVMFRSGGKNHKELAGGWDESTTLLQLPVHQPDTPIAVVELQLK